MKTTLTLIATVVVLTGCQSNKIAEETLDKGLVYQTNLLKNYDEKGRNVVFFMSQERLDKQVMQVKIDTLEAMVATGSKTISYDDLKTKLDGLNKNLRSDNALITEIKDQYQFLAQQGEKEFAWMLNLNTYIQGKKSILEIMIENYEKDAAAKKAALNTPASQPFVPTMVIPTVK